MKPPKFAPIHAQMILGVIREADGFLIVDHPEENLMAVHSATGKAFRADSDTVDCQTEWKEL